MIAAIDPMHCAFFAISSFIFLVAFSFIIMVVNTIRTSADPDSDWDADVVGGLLTVIIIAAIALGVAVYEGVKIWG